MRKLPHTLKFGTNWDIEYNTSLSYKEDSGYYCISFKLEQIKNDQLSNSYIFQFDVVMGNTHWPDLRYSIILKYPFLASEFNFAYSNFIELLEQLDYNEIRDIRIEQIN